MFEELKEYLKNSYSPYSNFKVSSCLVTKNNKKYFGVNVENASYGASICAERVAITKALSEGEKKEDFKEIYILGSTSNTMPCFICRQTFAEFFDENVKIYIYDTEGNYEKYSMNELCPYPFSLGDIL